MLLPLVASLLKADYIVIVAVPQVKEAESLERRLSGLDEKRGLRVLIYNPEDVSPMLDWGSRGLELMCSPTPFPHSSGHCVPP